MLNINFASLKNSECVSNWKTPAPNEVLKKFPSLYLPLSHHSLLWRKSIKKAKMELPPTSAMETISIVNLRRRGKENETQKQFERIEGQLWIFSPIFPFCQSMCIKMPCKLLKFRVMAGVESKRDGIVCLLGASRLFCVLLSFVIMRSSSPLVGITVILHAAREWSGEVFYIHHSLAFWQERQQQHTKHSNRHSTGGKQKRSRE